MTMQTHGRAIEVLEYTEGQCRMEPRFANTLMLAHLLAHAERQTALLEQIATALEGRRPDLK